MPGLRKAAERFGERVEFVCADGTALPFPDGSLDVLVFNHIYEHVVDPDAIMAEMRRVLSDDGVLYLGLGNRLGVDGAALQAAVPVLPAARAGRPLRAAPPAGPTTTTSATAPGAGCAGCCAAFHVWDYTFPVLATPTRFAGSELFPGALGRVARAVLARTAARRCCACCCRWCPPTCGWRRRATAAPAGAALPQPPERVRPL